jgi:hypothetical protein
MKFSDVAIGALFILGGEVFIKTTSKAAQGMHTRRTIKPEPQTEVTA